jgi:hypothetical protein
MMRSPRVRLTLLPLLASAALAASPAEAQSPPPLIQVSHCEDGSDDCATIDPNVTDGNGSPVFEQPATGFVSSGFGYYFWSGG